MSVGQAGVAPRAIDLVGPFVGRKLALEAGQEALTQGRSVAFVGPVGSGRTRTVTELADRVTEGGSPVIRGLVGLRSVHLGALLGALPDAPADVDAVRRCIDHFRRLADVRPHRELVVDDAHLLDAASAAVLSVLHASHDVRLLLTFAAEEPIPSDLFALWRDGSCWRVDLGPLDEGETAEFVSGILGGPVSDATITRLWTASIGNPLFLRELVHEGHEGGLFSHGAAGWSWRGPMGRGRRLHVLVADRVHRLAPALRQALEVLVLAAPVSVDAVTDFVSSHAIDALEQEGLVIVRSINGHDMADFASPIVRTILLEGLGKATRRRLATRVLDAIDSNDRPRTAEESVRRGTLALIAGRRDDALFLDSARAALDLHDLYRAEAFARRARTLAVDPSEATHVLAETLAGKGRHVESLRELRTVGPVVNDPSNQHTWALLFATNSVLAGDDRVAAVEVMTGHVAPDGHEGEPGAVQSWIELFDGEVADASSTAYAVLDDPDSSAVAIVWAGVAGAVAESICGDARRADLDLAAASARLEHGVSGLAFAKMQLGLASVFTEVMTGQWTSAVANAHRGKTNAAIDGEPPEVVGAWAGFLALASKESGDLAAAAASLTESVDLMGEIDPYQFRALTYAELGACEAVLGHREAAHAALAHSDAIDPGGGLFTALLLRNRGWVYAADGETVRCAESLDAAAVHARKKGQTIIELLIHVDLARLVRRRFSAHDAQRLTIVEHHGSRLLVATADAFSTRLPAECASVSQRLAAAGSHFLAGEAAIAASLRDPQHALLALKSCRGNERLWRTPIRVQALAGVDALTPREGELARLVAAGRTSAEVAALLGITVRTVDNQLGRVYRKLGLRGRRELES